MNDAPSSRSPSDAAAPAYQVLARKYRPGSFRELIGQEAMVRTLTNAFARDRIAHAFILTGVRGVGKTTTARIIARGLNCLRDEKPTVEPCGTCEACIAIAEGRHVDVLEIDAASHTGVDNIREIVESVRYRAASARYKVYIVDEVHMLSTSAFNALLKTLEEPPPHVKFIFATTEIRKVPVTVLSRCQRFDLRRIEPEQMMAHLRSIAEREGARIADEALALITRAAEGSVRDALSLLDQALAHGRGGDGEIGAAEVRAMLGLADRARVIDLFEAIMRGDVGGALEELGRQYAEGADPAVVLRDLAELTHWVSVLKIAEGAAADPTVSPEEMRRGRELAGRLSMRALTRAWQMLLKASEELPLAPTPMMAAEMAVIRLTHVADLPPPEELLRRLGAEGAGSAGATTAGSAGAPTVGRERGRAQPGPEARLKPVPTSAAAGGGAPEVGSPAGTASRPRAAASAASAASAEAREAAADAAPQAGMPAEIEKIEDVVALLRDARELRLLHEVETFVRPVRCRPGLVEFAPAPGAPPDLAGRLGPVLGHLTGRRWQVVVSDAEAQPSIAERRAAELAERKAEAAAHPLVQAALAAFPGAEIRAVRRRETAPVGVPGGTEPGATEAGGTEAADAEFSDLWDDDAGGDPFEEES